MNDIIIRDLTTYEECQQARDLQLACFGFSNSEGIHPPMLLIAGQNGGVVLGAFDGDKMVGYLFGFLGLHENRGPLKLCSQTMGVLPEYRGRGIAEQLKWAQRERALRLGLKLITWTFDPLEGPNAYLNLHKLGGIVRVYERNIYGQRFNALTEGMPTDRFLLEWWIEQLSHIQSPKPHLEGTVVTKVERCGPAQTLVDYDLGSNDQVVRIEIPANIQAIRKENMTLAIDWRLKTREILETYFNRQYVALDFVSEGQDDTRRNFYLLWRPPDGWLATLTKTGV